MNEAVLKISDISIYGFGLLTVLSFLWGSFVFYKKAREAHIEDFFILDAVVVSAFWAFILGRAMFVIFNLSMFWNHWPRIFLMTNYPGLDRWGAILGIAVGILFVTRKVKGKFLDWFDLVSLGLLSGGAVFLAGLFLLTQIYIYLVICVLQLTFFVWTWSVEEKYRTYGWYRGKRTSARSGFITGFTLSFWGLSYLTERLVNGRGSFGGVIWALGLLVGGLVLVYIRSGRTVTDDIKYIFQHGRK